MSQGSEAAEQMTREAIQISEAAAKLAALGAKNLAALCLALANENQKLRGKTHMNALLRSGKELRVFDLKEPDLPAFQQAAKQYGVLFSVIKDTANGNGHVDILAKAEDVSKLNRIYEQLGYTVPKKISADRKNAETRRQTPDPMLTRGKTMEDIDPRPSFKTVAAQLRKAAARNAERAVNATRKEER